MFEMNVNSAKWLIAAVALCTLMRSTVASPFTEQCLKLDGQPWGEYIRNSDSKFNRQGLRGHKRILGKHPEGGSRRYQKEAWDKAAQKFDGVASCGVGSSPMAYCTAVDGVSTGEECGGIQSELGCLARPTMRSHLDKPVCYERQLGSVANPSAEPGRLMECVPCISERAKNRAQEKRNAAVHPGAHGAALEHAMVAHAPEVIKDYDANNNKLVEWNEDRLANTEEYKYAYHTAKDGALEAVEDLPMHHPHFQRNAHRGAREAVQNAAFHNTPQMLENKKLLEEEDEEDDKGI